MGEVADQVPRVPHVRSIPKRHHLGVHPQMGPCIGLPMRTRKEPSYVGAHSHLPRHTGIAQDREHPKDSPNRR